MLETRLKIAFLLAVLFFTSLPVMGILEGTRPTPKEDVHETSTGLSGEAVDSSPASYTEQPVVEDMVFIPAGPFVRGTQVGGFDERPERSVYLSAYSIDRHEVTNFHYQAFVAATKHRHPGPPSRYAKNLSRIRGVNQPIVYVSWDDAHAYCSWNDKRLPTEAEWEKAMRGTDGRLWPWGNVEDPGGANLARVSDGYEVTAPIGSFPKDISPFGVADGTGNAIEWVADWYGETYYRDGPIRDPQGPPHGVFKGLRGGGYTSTGSDIRITSRSKMVPDFRDEMIGFRCAILGDVGDEKRGPKLTKSYRKSK
jgi:formylglycine-generating enzyme